MKDKNQLPESNSIKEVSLEEPEIVQMFPTADLTSVRLLEVIVLGEHKAYLAIDFPPGQAALLHLYIIPEHIHTENITEMIKIYYELVVPWVNLQGKDMLVVQCSTEDTKTATLMRTFGFELTPVYLGVMYTGE